MNRRTAVELVIVGLWLIIAAILFVDYKKDTKAVTPIPQKLQIPPTPDAFKGKTFEVTKIIVLRGDSFDLTIKDKDNSRIIGKLSVLAAENAKEKVIDLLNHITNPKVALLDRQQDGRWDIDLFFIKDGKEVSLSDWLTKNNLIYR